MKIAIRKEPNGLIYIDKNLREDIPYTEPPYNFTIIEVEKEDCVESDFNDDLTFNLDKYNDRKQRGNNCVKLEELDNWFKNNYTMYEQMLVRRKTLGIDDTIVDGFRNKTYNNLVDLYNEGEIVAGEIRVLKEKLKTEV